MPESLRFSFTLPEGGLDNLMDITHGESDVANQLKPRYRIVTFMKYESKLPEKVRLLQALKQKGFTIPDFIYLTADDFNKENFAELKEFLCNCGDDFVIVRSAHILESAYKGGTFDSLETNADIKGICYARKKIIRLAETAKKLHILRQQKFYNAPDIDLQQMGVIIMPFIKGLKVMAKKLGRHWEFGYTNEYTHKIQCESYITETPHDMRLWHLSKEVQEQLGFPCEIEYILDEYGEIFVVQAKDISKIEVLDLNETKRSIQLDGVRRIRKRRNYRERVIYLMDNRSLYFDIISKCEELVLDSHQSPNSVESVLQVLTDFEEDMEKFALDHERFAVLGASIKIPDDLFQIANHYLDDFPERQKQVSKALYKNQYRIDYFLTEADTIIAKDRLHLNLCTHDAYGIDTVRNPLWFVYWRFERQDDVVQEIRSLGFKTGDVVGIDISPEGKPLLYRL